MKQVVINNRILNSPYAEPQRHFRFSDKGITNIIVKVYRTSSYFVPIPQTRNKNPKQLTYETEWTADHIEENRFINQIRERVALWCRVGYSPHNSHRFLGSTAQKNAWTFPSHADAPAIYAKLPITQSTSQKDLRDRAFTQRYLGLQKKIHCFCTVSGVLKRKMGSIGKLLWIRMFFPVASSSAFSGN